MIKGYTYGWDGRRGMYKSEESFESMKRMTAMGCNWTALAFGVLQKTFSSTEFGFDYRFTVTDREIITAIERLKSLGQKVCLKPVINCADGVWRAHISFPETEFPVHIAGKKGYWDEWFDCYTAFICHYAEIAEDTGCEMLCIGCEMLGTERKSEHWYKLIERVRAIYSGQLVYNTNHGSEKNVRWFDALDYIGTSAYFTVGKNGSSVESMLEQWEKEKKPLREVCESFGKKMIFMEIGCRSATGCSAMPWDFTHRDLPPDEDEQDNFYKAAFLAVKDEPWFEGFFWWDWSTKLGDITKASENTGFSIYGKKAEKTLTELYNSVQ